MQAARRQNGGGDLQHFIQDLGMRLTAWQATTFLVGEFQMAETEDHPVFTVADGLVWLHQSLDRNSMVRKMQVMKMRGQAPIPGLHTFRITNRGIQVFPRLILPCPKGHRRVERPRRSVEHHGCPLGSQASTRCWAAAFRPGNPSSSPDRRDRGRLSSPRSSFREGVRRGEPGVIAIFEKRPDEYAQTSAIGLDQAVRDGQVGIIHTRPLDLSIDETQHELTEAIQRLNARRVVIDSLSGFELALAPTFREDFRESLYRLVAALTGMGVTVMMTAELEDTYTHLRFSPHGTAFLTDAIIVQRYLELEGQLQRVMAVVKVRASAHSKDLRLFEISADGITVGERVGGLRGTTHGQPTRSLSRTSSATSSDALLSTEIEDVTPPHTRRSKKGSPDRAKKRGDSPTPRNRHVVVRGADTAASTQHKDAVSRPGPDTRGRRAADGPVAGSQRAA
jgi:circadian clock protein KaiC